MTIENEIGLLTNSPVYIGDQPALEMDLSIITYDPGSAQLKNLSNTDELPQYNNYPGISWINISGLKDIASIKHLSRLYSIHPLTVEDILHTEQQPKLEMFDAYRFLSIKTIQRQMDFHENGQEKNQIFTSFFEKRKKPIREKAEFLIEQISFIIMKDVLITIQEKPGDPFDGVRKRIMNNIGAIRKMGTDYLAYALLDAVVDDYSLAIDHLEDDVENFEDRATKTSDDTFIEEIQDTKKYLLQIKRAISPLKNIITAIPRQEKFFETDELKPFYQDLNENLHNAIITVENYREWLSNIMDVNLSVLTYQLNKVMKTLAIISAIVLPLSFIAGIYGMNFHFMPELAYEYAYPIVLATMAVVASIMVIIFKTRRWF